MIDTNVFISALRSRRGASFKLLSLVGSGAFEINLSVPLILEYESVAKRSKHLISLDTEDVDDVLNYLCKWLAAIKSIICGVLFCVIRKTTWYSNWQSRRVVIM